MLIELRNIDPDSETEFTVTKLDTESDIETLDDIIPLLIEHGLLNEGDNVEDLEMGDGEDALFILKGDNHIATILLFDSSIYELLN